MSPSGNILTTHTFGLLLAGTLALCSCREEEAETLPAFSAVQPEAAEDAEVGTWLEVTKTETPLDFISRMTGAPAAQVAPRLDRATDLYQESPRMIANRSVQLWQEIGEKQKEIPITDLLDDLAPDNIPLQTNSLTTVIQNYRVLRSQGADHVTAIATATQGAR